MNVYDFDKTIYEGDSTLDFYKFCIKRNPSLLRYLPKQAYAFVKFFFGSISKTVFKEMFYSFLNSIDNIDETIALFWNENRKKIKPWCLSRLEHDDIIISASPEFLLSPVCKDLDISLIASRVDKETGAYTGDNCHGNEKLNRFCEVFGDRVINCFYSDSLSDLPLAQIAENSFIVKRDLIIPWEQYSPGLYERFKRNFFSKKFVFFLAVGLINVINGVIFAYLYSSFLDANFAFILGFITSLTISYILNSLFTFKEQLSFKKYLKFCISNIPNFIIQNLFVMFLYNFLGWYKILTYCIAAVIGVPLTFIIVSKFTFKNQTIKR